MKEIKDMDIKTDLYYRARYIADKFGIKQKVAEDILKSDAENIEFLLLHGQSVKLSGIGTFKIKTQKAREAHEGVVNPSTGEKGIVPASKAYSKVLFSLTKPIKDKLKEITYGNPFD